MDESIKNDQETKNDQESKNDNLMNVMSNIGVPGKAKNPASFFGAPKILANDELDNIYLGDGFGKKIVDVYPNTMVREWIKIEGDPDKLLLNYLERLSVKQTVNSGLKWSRLYGASIILMIIDDGGELLEPVNIKDIKTIDSLRVIDKTQLSVQDQEDLYNDPTKSNFGKIMLYTVSPPQAVRFGGTTGNTYKVHESRVLRFDGEIAPTRLMINNGYFAYSVLQPIYKYLSNAAQAYEMSSEILHEFTTSVLSMKNLTNIASSKGGIEAIKARIELMAYSKSVINGVLLDADGEQYDKKSTALSGLPEIIDKFALALSAVSGIPYIILMGDTPSGLNANGNSDVRAWYDSVANEQHEILTPQLNKLLSYILAANDNPLKNKNMDDLEIVYNPLWQIDEPTQVDMRNKQAQTDKIYLEDGVVMPEEIAQSRFGDDKYSFETIIDPSTHNNGDS